MGPRLRAGRVGATGTTGLLGPEEGLEDTPFTEATREGTGVAKKLCDGRSARPVLTGGTLLRQLRQEKDDCTE